MIVFGGLAAQADHEVEIGVLGPFRARVGGQWCDAPTRQVARVGTILAGWPGEQVERDVIVADLWGDNAPATATNTVQAYVSTLRRLLGKKLVLGQGTSYLLDVPVEAVDAERFQELVHDAARLRRREHVARAAELLSEALGLWRGTPFADVPDPDLEARRARLTEMRDQAREDLLECRLELAADAIALADVIAEAKELISRDPLRENRHAILVRALASADRVAEASAAFETARARVREEQGLDPGRALVDIHTRALTGDRSILPRAMRRGPAAVPTRRAQAEHGEAARRVREAVVDIGAQVVTVVAPGADDALGEVIAYALAADLPEGAWAGPSVPATLPERSAVVVHAAGAVSVPDRPWGAGAVLVLVGADPLGLDDEVVVDLTDRQAVTPSAPAKKRGA